ncbi:MAG: transposase, partial [Gammaproteobacteria bacterium]|nr:transposase [Gammaproteobacteria bacterium]
MRRKRRNHSAAFTAKVAGAAMKGDKTRAQLASDHDIHVNQIQSWQKQLKENINGLFERQAEKRKDYEGEIKQL